VIENIQRDVNIALVNELALLFDKLGLETNSVLEAARTKWNFMDFRPGLVGGHCIGVDPYYLTHKAQAVGYHPEMILAGRRLNDGMARFVAEKMLVKMAARGFAPTTSKVLLLGLTFKENCTDLRNSQAIKVYQALKQFGFSVDVFDPVCDPNLALSNYNIDVSEQVVGHDYDGIVVVVGHKEFVELGELVLRDLCKPKGVIFDVKSIFPGSSGFIRL
jgi:UDP-N-acetyl-D-galactosamine dehydrogenase